ncbi:MAG TPA: glutamyl-tRNA reductase [Ktedonobacterales bacterium]
MIGMIGLDHHSTDVEQRGRLSFAGERLEAALGALAGDEAIREAVILSTCNRTEVYVAAGEWLPAAAAVRRLLAAANALGATALVGAIPSLPRTGELSGWVPEPGSLPELPRELDTALYEHEGLEAARHLLRVASGLRSMVVGEAQILGQVKEALTAAEQAGTVGEELRALFTTAIKTGKRVRTETGVARADVSVAGLAVRVAGEALGDLRDVPALLIGAGKTSQLCARLLREAGAGRLLLANRTPAAASALAAEVGGEVIGLREVEQAIPNVRLIVSATTAPRPMLSVASVARGMQGRRSPLVVFDLAVPPDVEEAVGLLPHVSLYTLDTLRALEATTQAPTSTPEREAELARAEHIVEDGVRELARLRTLRLAVPGIAALRRHVDRSEEAEVARALAALEHLSDDEKAVVARFGQRLVDKMFHHLVARIRSLAEYDEVPPDVTMRVLARLFADPDGERDEGSDARDKGAGG